MKLDKEYLLKVVGDESIADFYEKTLSEKSSYSFLDKLNKNIKKQVVTAINFEKVIDGAITYEQLDDSLKSKEEVKVNFKGYAISGEISLTNLNYMLAFLGINNNPKFDSINNSNVFNSKNYILYVSDLNTDRKNLVLLYKYETNEQINELANAYFTVINEIKSLTEDELIKLNNDPSELQYKSDYKDFYTNNDLYNIQDSLFNTYDNNPFDFLVTLAVLYRLRSLGWDRSYIDFASQSNKAFNILNSTANVKISGIKIEALLNNGFIDENYDLTISGRTALQLLNYYSPLMTNNMGNFYAPMSYYSSLKDIDKSNFLKITVDNNGLYGIKDEFFVSEEVLGGLSTNFFNDNSEYNTFILNSINKLNRGREVGYTPNIKISDNESFDLEICQQMFNTFSDDVLNTIGGLVMLKTYDSSEPIFVNSLVLRLIKSHHYNISPFLSQVNSDYVLIRENEKNRIVGIIKTKSFSCQKDIISTQDKNILIKKITNKYNDKINKGLNITINNPYILGVGYVEKAELTNEDFNYLLTVSFSDLKITVRNLNKDKYFNELNEVDIIQKIISNRKVDYDKFVDGVKENMNRSLKALETLQSYFVEVGNTEKQSYYSEVIEDYKNKIESFVI